MSRLIIAVAFFGLVAVTSASTDPNAEWTGKPWLGKWESVRDENWQALVDALGLPTPQYSNLGHSKSIVKLYKVGDKYHQVISIPDKHYKNAVEFKLGEEFTINKNGTDITIKFTEDGDKLKADLKAPSRNKELHDTYEVTGEELVKTYKSGDVTAKRWFKKVAHTTTAPPAAAA